MADALQTLAEKYAIRYNTKPSWALGQVGHSTQFIAKVAELLADDAGLLNDVARETLHQRENEVAAAEDNIRTAMTRLEATRRQIEQERVSVSNMKFDAEQLLKQAQEQAAVIAQYETPEARDKARLLELFKQAEKASISDKRITPTPQNHTAFINACGSILGSVPLAANVTAANAETDEQKQSKGNKKLNY